MSILTQRKKKLLIQSTETVSTNWTSPSVSLDDRAEAFSILVKYDNGTAVNMKVYVQLSNDDVNFASIDESLSTLTDPSGAVLYDLSGSGTQYARIYIQVIAGSIDVTAIRYTASQF